MGKKKMNAKKLIKDQQDGARKKAQAFLDDYEVLKKKHGLMFKSILKFDHEEGIVPTFTIKELPTATPTIAEWSKALKENLETRKKCKHEKMSVNGGSCMDCSTDKEAFGENGHGVNQTYIDKMEAKIKEEEEKPKDK